MKIKPAIEKNQWILAIYFYFRKEIIQEFVLIGKTKCQGFVTVLLRKGHNYV